MRKILHAASSGIWMAYEYPTPAGTVLLAKAGRVWGVEFIGKKRGRWRSPDAAATAVARLAES